MITTNHSAELQNHPVQLYIYDLSNGLARSLSRQLTGRHFDAIYHTSIVVYGREWYFGQGIFDDSPGRTHFGQPIEKCNLGETSIDPVTFQEILVDLRERYTAQAYHLLQFNCNTFSNELSNILVGRDIPSHITSLPQDFLATPFGRMMGPQIDAMFRGGPSNIGRAPMANGSISNAPPSAMGILNNVTHSAIANGNSASSKIAVHPLQSIAQFEEFKRAAPSAVVMFTSNTCPPCAQMHPVYESIAEKYSEPSKYKHRPIVFGQVYSHSGQMIMQQQNISATPTFQFYIGGKMVNEVKGANPSGLEDGIENLLWSQHRPHPHSKLPNPSSLVPRKAIKYETIPNQMSAQQKFNEITSKHPAKSFAEKADIQDARSALTKILFPWIHQRMSVGKQQSRLPKEDIGKWIQAATKCIELLGVSDIFPVIDLVRIAVLDESQSTIIFQTKDGTKLLEAIWAKTKSDMNIEKKATLLTTYRLVGNSLATKGSLCVAESSDVISLLVYGVLCEDDRLRGAAINAVFNRALLKSEGHSLFVAAPKEDDNEQDGASESDEEVELICATLECIEKEEDLERLHRATAALLLSLYCAPSWNSSLQSLLEVLEASNKMESKLASLKSDSSEKAKDVCNLLESIARLIRAK